MQRFRGGLVFEAHRLLCHSTPDLRVMKNKQKKKVRDDDLGSSSDGRLAHSWNGTRTNRPSNLLSSIHFIIVFHSNQIKHSKQIKPVRAKSNRNNKFKLNRERECIIDKLLVCEVYVGLCGFVCGGLARPLLGSSGGRHQPGERQHLDRTRVAYRVYRVTSLIRNSAPLGPYSSTMSRTLWWP